MKLTRMLGFIGIFIASCTVVHCSRADDDFEVIKLREASVKYQKFADNNYAPYFDKPQKERLSLVVNSDLLKYGFWNNRVHGTTTEDQYRWVGWNFQVGVRLFRQLDVQYEHHSQHAMDYNIGAHFPVEDSVGFTLYFYRIGNNAPSIF